MARALAWAVAGILLLAPGLLAQEGIQRGKIKKIDKDKGALTITVGSKDYDVTVTERTRVFGATGTDVKERLKAFKVGAEVRFKVEMRDGREVLVGLMLAGGGADVGRNPPPKVDTSSFKPLTELGTGLYKGSPGGLYPAGKNERPSAHKAAGLALAKKVRPLDGEGKPAEGGKIVLLSIGMSNTTQEFSAFKSLADGDEDRNPHLAIVDGAQGGMTAAAIRSTDSPQGKRFWSTVDERLQRAGVTRQQVQVAWIKEADAGPSQGFPAYAQTLENELGQIARLLHDRFPNLKLAYLSSRTYGGYATTRLNPEPYAYESGFSVKWLIEKQIHGDPELNYDAGKGAVRSPWLSWGPYLWANGTTKRSDGFFYEPSDFGGDGTHPSQSGRRKVAELLLKFFKTDTTARPWFVKK
jgi:hypothetical protein